MAIFTEAIRYLGQNVVVIRSWDGYDKPQKIPIFKITEKELDFEGGRFNLFAYALVDFSQKFALADEDTKLEDVINWIAKNVEELWYFDISDSFADCYINGEYYWYAWVFFFKSHEDCVKFTLRWM